jgi:hypothetical protein
MRYFKRATEGPPQHGLVRQCASRTALGLAHAVWDTAKTTAAGRYTTRVVMMTRARHLAAVVSAAGLRYLSSGACDSAAGIAYRVLFSLVPLPVALASVFGLLLQKPGAEDGSHQQDRLCASCREP